MNKKLLMVAVGAALAAGPMLANAAVTIYGTFNMDVENVSNKGGTASGTANSLVGATGATPTDSAARNRGSSNSSNIGFRGTEDLGGGLKAIWQMESSLNLDASGGTLAGRNTYLGLAGEFGSIKFAGGHDSPYKDAVQGKDPFFVTGIATQKGILGSPGFGTISTTLAPGGVASTSVGYDMRLNNAIFYATPNMNGLTGEIAYVVNEGKSTTTTASPVDPTVISMNVKYDQGPLFLAFAYETRDDHFGLTGIGAATGSTANTGTTSKDTGTKLGLGYKLDTTEFLLVYEMLEYENSGTTTNVNNYERDAFVASVSHSIGNNRFSLSFGKADEGSCSLTSGAACSTSGLGATQTILGYAHSLSKSTQLYAHYTEIDNDDKASYFFGVAGAASGLPGAVGADPKGLALGMRHKF